MVASLVADYRQLLIITKVALIRYFINTHFIILLGSEMAEGGVEESGLPAQADVEMKSQISEEAVSDWTKDLSDIILVQRARVVNLQSEVEKRKAERKLKAQEDLKEAEIQLWSQEALLREAIIAHTAEVEKLIKENKDISEAKQRLEPLKSRLREAIIFQGARVRKLEGKSEKEEALKRQETLRADYKAATGMEWSDVRDEGPILMTSNAVRGSEVRQELKQRLKDFREQNIIR